MTTPPDDLEEKVDLLLENITLQEEREKNLAQIQELQAGMSKLRVENKVLRRPRWKEWILAGVGSIAFYLAAINLTEYWQEKSQAQTQKASLVSVKENTPTFTAQNSPDQGKTSSPLTVKPALSSSLDTITKFKFTYPFTINASDEGSIYVFDAGNGTIHKFYLSGHIENRYGDRTINKFYPSAHIKGHRQLKDMVHSDAELIVSHYERYFTPEKKRQGITPIIFGWGTRYQSEELRKIQIDYLDKTITTYNADNLHFVERRTKTKALHKRSDAHCTATLHDILQKYGADIRDNTNLIDQFIKTPNQKLFDGICNSFVQEDVDGNYQEEVKNVLQTVSHHVNVVEAGPDPVPLNYNEFITNPGLYSFLPALRKAVAVFYYEGYKYESDYFKDAPRPTLGNDAPVDVKEDFDAFQEGLRYFIAREIVRKKPNNYFQLNDKPSQKQAVFSALLPLSETGVYERLSPNNGLCALLPVLAFNDAEKSVIFGYVCHDGTIEEHQRISYDSIYRTLTETQPSHGRPPMEPSQLMNQPTESGSNIIDYAQYENKVYFIERGHPYVRMIEIKNDN